MPAVLDRHAAALRTAAGLVVALAAAGVAIGAVWWWVAPVAQVRIEADGGYFTQTQPQQFIVADGWFALLTAAAGVVAGLAAWWWVRVQRYGAVAGLAVGGGFGAVVAWQTGEWLGRVDLDALAGAPVGTVADVALQLGMHGLLLVEPVTALLVWLAADLLVDRTPEGARSVR